MKSKYSAVIPAIFLFSILLASGALSLFGGVRGSPDVPSEYQQLYSFLEATLNAFDPYLNSRDTGAHYPVIFGAELLPANSNRGTELFAPQTMQAVILYLDRLQELGVQGVTIPIGYPLYTPDFPHYQDYVQFYRQVVQEVRKRGMTLAVESSAIFANTEFSKLQVDYSGLTFEKFEAERKQMIATLIRDIKPDYLNLGAEPDTQYQLLGLRELSSPEKYTEYINYVLTGLERGNTKIGAGIGTWGNLEYVRSLASQTTLDSIHVHVYPIYGNDLQNILTISDIARQYGKRIVLDEAWLSKVEKPTGGGVASAPEIFRRDAFSFWAPLDQRFLAVIAKSARVAQIDYISPFWTQYFFGYVDYTSSNADLSFKDLAAMVNQVAYSNILAGQFSSTGEFYRQITSGSSSITTTLQASSSAMPSTLEGTTTNSSWRLPVFAIGLVVAAITIGIVILVVLRFRRPRS